MFKIFKQKRKERPLSFRVSISSFGTWAQKPILYSTSTCHHKIRLARIQQSYLLVRNASLKFFHYLQQHRHKMPNIRCKEYTAHDMKRQPRFSSTHQVCSTQGIVKMSSYPTHLRCSAVPDIMGKLGAEGQTWRNNLQTR